MAKTNKSDKVYNQTRKADNLNKSKHGSKYETDKAANKKANK